MGQENCWTPEVRADSITAGTLWSFLSVVVLLSNVLNEWLNALFVFCTQTQHTAGFYATSLINSWRRRHAENYSNVPTKAVKKENAT